MDQFRKFSKPVLHFLKCIDIFAISKSSTKKYTFMLGLLLIYFIGKYFYELAGQYKKGPWLYAILGVISYYVGTFIGGFVIAILYEMFSTSSFEDIPDMGLSLIALPFGLVTCWLFYILLKRQWAGNTATLTESDILDDDLLK